MSDNRGHRALQSRECTLAAGPHEYTARMCDPRRSGGSTRVPSTGALIGRMHGLSVESVVPVHAWFTPRARWRGVSVCRAGESDIYCRRRAFTLRWLGARHPVAPHAATVSRGHVHLPCLYCCTRTRSPRTRRSAHMKVPNGRFLVSTTAIVVEASKPHQTVVPRGTRAVPNSSGFASD